MLKGGCLLLVVMCVVFSPGAQALDLQGHRGARGRFPENSLPGFEYALGLGVDTLELDLGVTKDRVLVLNHDAFIDPERCLGPKKKSLIEKIPLISLNYSELKTYTCGSLPHKRFPKQKKMSVGFPTLREVFDMVKNSKLPVAKTVRFNIETKLVPGEPEMTPAPEEFAKLVLELVKEYGWLDRVTLQSFDHRSLRAAKAMEPKISIAPLIENTLPDLVELAKGLKADIVSPNHLWITKVEVDALHAKGVRVIPWTANTEREWERLLELKVDGIITDYPEECLAFLKARGAK